MANYKFYVDEKRTMWYRSNINISAESLEEAKEIIKQKYNSNELEQFTTESGWEQMEDCDTMLSPEDNDGWATEEIFCDEDNELLIDNGTRHL
jgi:hypothetical protein